MGSRINNFNPKKHAYSFRSARKHSALVPCSRICDEKYWNSCCEFLILRKNILEIEFKNRWKSYFKNGQTKPAIEVCTIYIDTASKQQQQRNRVDKQRSAMHKSAPEFDVEWVAIGFRASNAWAYRGII